jgi:hypothetical protein
MSELGRIEKVAGATIFVVLSPYFCGRTKENHEKSEGDRLYGWDSYLIPSAFVSSLKHFIVKVMQRRQGKKNSVASVRQRTIPTERQPLVNEVSANFLWIEGVAWSARRIPMAVFSVFWTGAATFSSK